MNPTRDQWLTRQQEHGNSPRAVLMKGVPAPVNDLIDQWHKAVLRHAFDEPGRMGRSCLDLGCGYGRLASEAAACGLCPVVGMDFTPGFCVDFAARHGPAVCGKLDALPFMDATFDASYCVTALMYLSVNDARSALLELDRSARPGAKILVIEPAREFNALVRFFARGKRNETLTQPGLSLHDITHAIVPPGWRRRAGGGCWWMTWLLPLLMVCARSPRLFRILANLVLRLDSPARTGRGLRLPRIAMYRWIVFDKPENRETTETDG